MILSYFLVFFAIVWSATRWIRKALMYWILN